MRRAPLHIHAQTGGHIVPQFWADAGRMHSFPWAEVGIHVSGVSGVSGAAPPGPRAVLPSLHVVPSSAPSNHIHAYSECSPAGMLPRPCCPHLTRALHLAARALLAPSLAMLWPMLWPMPVWV